MTTSPPIGSLAALGLAHPEALTAAQAQSVAGSDLAQRPHHDHRSNALTRPTPYANAVKMNPLLGTILEPEVIEYWGWQLYSPDRAPTLKQIMAHWSDGVIAVSYQTEEGQWVRLRNTETIPVMEPTNARLEGWCPLSRAL
jgi:hypothetical protein